MTTIPCKRPKVTVGQRGDTYVVRCDVPGCGFQYPADARYVAVKTDADQHAGLHRSQHRNAVPRVRQSTVSDEVAVKVDVCACGWVTPEGFSTVADRKRKLDEHLSAAHGLVVCP